jgi:predicted TIM-barrel fold metal-dependent hydrolase
MHLFSGGFWEVLNLREPPDAELHRYLAVRADHGIDRSLVVAYEGEPRFAGNNADLARYRAAHPWMAPVAYERADAPPTPDRLAARRAQGFVGISLYVLEPHDADVVAAWPRATLRALADAAAVVSINAPPPALARLGPLVDALEGGSVLISHLGLPGARAHPPTPEQATHALEPLLALAERPQLAVKWSALYASSDPPHRYPHLAARPYLDVLLDRLGPGRLLWGSDWSPCLHAVSVPQAVDVLDGHGLTDGERSAIGGGNLRTLLARAETASA